VGQYNIELKLYVINGTDTSLNVESTFAASVTIDQYEPEPQLESEQNED
jgi:hypothetical protein